MEKWLYFPMAFYAVYIFFLLFVNFRVRAKAVRSGEVHGGYFKLYRGEDLPEKLAALTRHIDNQFQTPMYFMISCLAAIQSGVANEITLVLAWLFVLSRMAHSYIHLGSNKILKRAKVYALGWLFIFAIWCQVLVGVF